MSDKMPEIPDTEPKRCPMMGGVECIKERCAMWRKWNGCAIAQLPQVVDNIGNRLGQIHDAL